MFSLKVWLASNERDRVDRSYGSIHFPQQWKHGRAEDEALQIARDHWQPAETYWLYQPSLRQALW